MFTKRHEQELAEVKELTFELRSRFDEVIKELERIRATPGPARRQQTEELCHDAKDEQGREEVQGREQDRQSRRAGDRQLRRGRRSGPAQNEPANSIPPQQAVTTPTPPSGHPRERPTRWTGNGLKKRSEAATARGGDCKPGLGCRAVSH